ncbi:unnamed protein product, partial [Rotaria sp. Silwood1]
MSFDFHPNTFKQLFDIIQQLTVIPLEDLNMNLTYILIICLRLFTKHLKFLFVLITNPFRNLLFTNDDIIKPVSINQDIDLNEFIHDNDLQTWFDTLLILACRDDEKLEQITICRQASKALMQILNKKMSTFTEKLSFIHKYIIENKHLILINELVVELNKNTTLLCWIELLCNNKSENITALNILYSFIDISFNSSNEMESKMKQQIQQILQRFQQFLFIRLSSTSSLANKYITYILSNLNDKLVIENELLNSILISLGLLTETHFNFVTIQPLITSVLPLLADLILKSTMNEGIIANNLSYMYWVLGKMSATLMVGPQPDALEMKYVEKLQSPLFAGGCERLPIENNQYLLNLLKSNIANFSGFKITDYNLQQSLSDHEFLMSIYNNIDQGAKLISKMKIYMKDKQNLVQKSIEQQANNACAALFAVYIKYYRRINLAKSELSRTDDNKPHKKLLSIFEYANLVQILFAKTKGQGGNCDELYEQIKMNTLFLLTSIKESNLIPIIEYETNEQVNKPKFKRYYSQKNIEKHNIRLLRNMFQACIRFKKLILINKKGIEDKQDNENILRRAIDYYIFNEKKSESDELIQCMFRQYERAILRLITYRFIHKFIEKLFDMNNQNQILILLRIYLPYLRKANIEWSYLENISTTNIQLKEDIGKNYYLIIKIILSYLLQSTNIDQMILIQNIFYLLNLSYNLIDIYCIHNNEVLQILFNKFSSTDLDVKFVRYNWFRLYVFKFCENFQIETNSILNEIQELIFEKIILTELKLLKQSEEKTILMNKNNSFNNVAIEWFIKAKDTNNISSKFDVDLYINQYLILLLRCVHLYEHVRSYCANDQYIEELIYIYRNSGNQITILISLKILQKLVRYLPEDMNGKTQLMMNEFLTNILSSIGKTTTDITTELIYIYRIIMSCKSPWQTMAIQIISDTITSNLKSFDSIDNLLASLCILGGYIQPFCLGSVIEIHTTDETQLGVIIDLNINSHDLDTSDTLIYLVQYIETNKTEWITGDKLKIKIDVLPPNLLDLPNANKFIDFLFDALAYFIQIDTSTTESLLFLQLKRRSIAVLYRILNHKKLVNIFMEKSYVSIIAKLSTSALLSKTAQSSIDLHLLNKYHLEQYCLNLDRCEYFKQILDDTNETIQDEFRIWTDVSFKKDQLTLDFSLTTNEWKSKMSKRELKLFKKGRFGNDEIKIIPMSFGNSGKWFIEECGITHRFPGRVNLISENFNTLFVTFIIDNLRLTEGNWYFCIRLLQSTSAQIGWATNGFKPNHSIGIGNDKYSWSYDGSTGIIYNNKQYSFPFENILWSTNDVCGCGIEINNDHIQINYWLNGYFLGTPFSHQFPINSTTKICNMLPNGYRTSYFPGVTLKVNNITTLSACEFIFHPMDMFECPLPNNYKPLLLPTMIDIDDSLVAYPFSAYLVGENVQDYFIPTRNNKSIRFLRDFINNYHLESVFIVENYQLILPEHNEGFPLTIDDQQSLTISFDFSVLKMSHDYLDIPLLTFDPPDVFSIQIPINKITNKTQIAIIFQLNERKIKIYINNECRILESPIITKFHIHILPRIAVGIENLAIWKYALSEEHIRRLFTSGLSYIAFDYYRLNEYRKQANILTFNTEDKYFENELKHFRTNNGTLQVFGNKTYFVLDKSLDSWSAYTLVFDISIYHLPIILVELNEQSQICIAHDGQLYLSINNEKYIQSESKLKLNEYIRLLIAVEKNSIKIYVNGLLELHGNVDNDQLTIKDKQINLFKELDSTNSTINEDTLRIECKSITYLNKAILDSDEQIKSPNNSLESLVAPPYSIISPSLIRIGYDELSIRSAMKYTMTTNIQLIDTILREKYYKHDTNILSKLGSSINKEKLKDLLQFSQFDTEEKIAALAEILLIHWNDIQTLSTPSIGKDWFYETIHHLTLNENLSEWIQDKSNIIEPTDLTYQLFDLNQSIDEQTKITTNIIDDQWKNIKYTYQHMTRNKYHQSRLACEYDLISIYAHYTIINILTIWFNDGSSLFPLEEFGDATFIVTLFRLLDYHTCLHIDETIDRMSLLINSILKVELNELLKYHRIRNNKITNDILQYKGFLLYYLQKDIMIQSIKILFDPSLLSSEYSEEFDIKKPNINFILKLLHLFVKFISEKLTTKQEDIDLLISLLFPESLVNILFNLFLINPMHQIKSTILQLLSSLIQTSDNSHLNQNIQHFLFHLFIELPPNSTSVYTQTMRTFQISLMNLIFLLTKRQKSQSITMNITNDQFNFPQSFHDLLISIDVIDALIDKTKHRSFPEMFIRQSIILLGKNLQFTRDDIEKSNNYFDTIADLQLINFMNNHLLLKISFIQFINDLPIGSIPNPTYYKTYPSLCHIPAIYIQIRAKLFYQFNIFIEKLVSVIDLSLLPGQSIVTDQIQKIKSYILYEIKSKLFYTTLTLTELETHHDMPTVNFNTVKASSGIDTMFNQAYDQLYNNAHITFRKEYNQLWHAQYLGMHSTDQGGPFRDSVTRICSDICSTRLSLFILCPNGRTNSGLNNDRWIPNVFPSNKSIPNRIKQQYQFIGQLMGMAIRKKHYLSLKFPNLLWKQLVRERITIEDIEDIDIQSFTMINEIEKMIKQNNQLIDIDKVLRTTFDELRFEVISSNGKTYELVPNGRNIPITTSNFQDYCSSYRQYRLNEFYRQIECIRQGLYSVVPGYFLGLFTANELEEAVCGKGEIDIELLKRNTEYGGRYNQNSPSIQQFWKILKEMFNEEQKKLFLKFVWGRCTLPSCDDDFGSKFRIEPYNISHGSVDGALPRSHTCTFGLDLPTYSSIDI